MTGEKIDLAEATAGADAGKRTRQSSQIEFPYGDLAEAITVARSIHENAGDRCTADQLAGWTGTTITSGAFRGKLTVARCFGIIEGGIGSELRLTQIGRMVVDPAQEREGRAQAFLAVPLYSRVFEDHRGHVLPPPKALERKMIDYGVPEKSAERARQVFDRAAEQSGFFASGRDRLVRPATGHRPDAGSAEASVAPAIAQQPTQPSTGAGGGGDKPLHPFIQGLLRTLPDPDGDGEWPLALRVKWLQTAANIFDLIYKGEGGIRVEAAMAQRSPRPE